MLQKQEEITFVYKMFSKSVVSELLSINMFLCTLLFDSHPDMINSVRKEKKFCPLVLETSNYSVTEQRPDEQCFLY